MTSPARKHYLRTVATQESLAMSQGQVMTGASQYELMLMKLATDKRRLKEIQSIERKLVVKRELIPEYDEWAQGAILGNGAQDDVLVTVMVWMLDVGDFTRAYPIVEYALTHHLSLPEHFERDLPTLVVDVVSDYVLNSMKEGEVFDILFLNRIEELTKAIDMPDNARAKLHKALGSLLLKREDKQGALAHFKRADELNSKVGVKMSIRALEKELGK